MKVCILCGHEDKNHSFKITTTDDLKITHQITCEFQKDIDNYHSKDCGCNGGFEPRHFKVERA